MPILATSTQFCTMSPSHSNYMGVEDEEHPNWRERSKIISVCRWNKSTENSKDATKTSMEIQ